MKRVLLILGLFSPLYAGHIALSLLRKCDFNNKRLAMMKDQLSAKKSELLELEESISQDGTNESGIPQLKEEIAELETCIPIIENSTHALDASK